MGSSCDLTDAIPFPLGAACKPSDRTHEQRTWVAERSEEACFVFSPAVGSNEQVATPRSCLEPRRATADQGGPLSVNPLTGFAKHAGAPHQQAGRTASYSSRHARAQKNGAGEVSERRGKQYYFFGAAGGEGETQAFGPAQPPSSPHLRGPALRIPTRSEPPLTPGATGGDRKDSGVLREGVPGLPRLPEARNLTNLLDARETDAVMTDYFNFLFLKGHPAHRGDKVLAWFVHHQPGYSRQGNPGSSRKAYPLAVWAALVLQLVLLVCLSAYTRPSELFRWRLLSLVRPTAQISTEWSLLLSPDKEGVRSKVGEFDDSLVLDSPYLKPWASGLFKTIKQGRPEEPLWDFPYCDFIRCFTKAADRLSLPVSPYQLRIDRSRTCAAWWKSKSGDGRWKSHKSVASYEKSARLAATFGSLPLRVQQFCLSAEKHLGDVMSGSCPKFE